jgi:Domain of unknown function (DUF927).
MLYNFNSKTKGGLNIAESITQSYPEKTEEAKRNEIYPFFVACGKVYKHQTNNKRKEGEDETGSVIPIADYTTVSYSEKNLDTDQIKLVLEFTNHGELVQTKIKPSQLTRRNFFELMDLGIDIRGHNASDLCDYLIKSSKIAPRKYVHESLGLGKYNGKQIFKLRVRSASIQSM